MGVSRRWSRGLPAIGLAAYGLIVAAGFAGFCSRRPDIVTPASSAAPVPSSQVVNLASLHAGGRVRVSSYDTFHSHEPLFLIDEEPRPTQLEKWATQPKTREAWLEVLLPRTSDVARVVLVHAGAYEDAGLTLRDYVIRCFGDRGSGGVRTIRAVEVRGNTAARAEHAVDCPGTDRVRIDFPVDPFPAERSVARIYEVEVRGTAR